MSRQAEGRREGGESAAKSSVKHTLFSTNRGERERERVHVIFDYGNFQLTALELGGQ